MQRSRLVFFQMRTVEGPASSYGHKNVSLVMTNLSTQEEVSGERPHEEEDGQDFHGREYDAIIIGAGLGGLSAASSLTQLAGMKCLIIEQHWVPGGTRPGRGCLKGEVTP